MQVIVNANTNEIVEKGSTVMDFNGEMWVLVGGYPPYKPSSTGRITVQRLHDPKEQRDFFPSVCGLKWVDESEAKPAEEQEYKVEITETLQRTIVVKAKSASEAIEKTKEMYHKEEIVLDSSDYIDTEYQILAED